MKSALLLTLFFSTSLFANELILINVPAGRSTSADLHSVRFNVNQETGAVAAKLEVEEEHEHCTHIGSDNERCSYRYVTLIREKAEIPGMKVVDNLVTFEDRIECGKIKPSRIFNVPTLRLNGACKLAYVRVKENGGRRVIVKLITKE